VLNQRERAQLTPQKATDGADVFSEPPQHLQISGLILGVFEFRRRAFGIAVSECDAAIVGHARGYPTVAVAVLQPVLVQQLAKGGIGGTRDEKWVPGRKRIMKVPGQRSLLGSDEPADLGVSLEKHH
jgi:hypothetical protein